jgi:glyoxylase-like metal-dependent hydrolase (beta-lactamase superfamily II)
MKGSASLPPGVTVFERGWLSSNNILFDDGTVAALVDSGYATHAPQTVELVRRALGGRPLDLLVNTHLHSDHCGGNAALQAAYPALVTLIPAGLAEAVTRWDTTALTYAPTGQWCDRFRFDGLLRPGGGIRLGGRPWEVHGAPGHDPHSVILFEPGSRTLISADALWENGFGVVFPELEGVAAFDEVAATLDAIERLAPLWIIPGHGRVFGGGAAPVAASVERARTRLDSFVHDPSRHAAHAAKVLLKFKLLELQETSLAEFSEWALGTPYFSIVGRRYFADQDRTEWLASLVADLVRSGAAATNGERIMNA